MNLVFKAFGTATMFPCGIVNKALTTGIHLRCYDIQINCWHRSSTLKEHHQFIGAFELIGTGSGCLRSSPETGYSSSPLFLAVSAPKRDNVTCSSVGTLTSDLFCSPHWEVPRLCHPLAQKGCVMSGDFTSLQFAGASGDTVMRYMTAHRYCLIVFELEPVSISFPSWVDQRYY